MASPPAPHPTHSFSHSPPFSRELSPALRNIFYLCLSRHDGCRVSSQVPQIESNRSTSAVYLKAAAGDGVAAGGCCVAASAVLCGTQQLREHPQQRDKLLPSSSSVTSSTSRKSSLHHAEALDAAYCKHIQHCTHMPLHTQDGRRFKRETPKRQESKYMGGSSSLSSPVLLLWR